QQEGIAALESHHPTTRARRPDQDLLDLLLAHRVLAGGLADLDHLDALTQVLDQGGRPQPVHDHHIGLLKQLHPAHRDQIQRTGAAADQGDAAGGEGGDRETRRRRRGRGLPPLGRGPRGAAQAAPVPAPGPAAPSPRPSRPAASVAAIVSFAPPPEATTSPVSRFQYCLYMGEAMVGTTSPACSPSTSWEPTSPRASRLTPESGSFCWTERTVSSARRNTATCVSPIRPAAPRSGESWSR